MSPPPIAICLMGATAAGKSALALRLCGEFPCEIVSVDSSQVYRGLDIGTAKPTPAEQVHTRHRLIDIRDPAQAYSAAEFRADALREMEDIRRQGRIPLLAGGTMFYFHALEFGLSELPSADAEIRARLAEEAARLGWPALHERLRAVDPAAAARIQPQDAQRLQRALEIYELTGQPPTEFAQAAPRERPAWNFIKLALFPGERAWLHARIARRFAAMLEQGLVAEVEGLYRRGDLHPGLPAIRTVGYRQVWEYLTGDLNYTEMTERAVIATRQLAKRQLTWLRSYPEVRHFDPARPDFSGDILAYLRQALRPA